MFYLVDVKIDFDDIEDPIKETIQRAYTKEINPKSPSILTLLMEEQSFSDNTSRV